MRCGFGNLERFGRLEDELLSDLAHFCDDLFQLPVVGNGALHFECPLG